MVRRYRAFGGRGRAERRPADINTIVRDSVQLLQYELRRMDVTVEMKLAEGMPAVSVDDVQIQQVLVNLIKNAIESMQSTPASERRITIASEMRRGTCFSASRTLGKDWPRTCKVLSLNRSAPTNRTGRGWGWPSAGRLSAPIAAKICAAENSAGGVTFQFNIPVGAIPPDRVGWVEQSPAVGGSALADAFDEDDNA